MSARVLDSHHPMPLSLGARIDGHHARKPHFSRHLQGAVSFVSCDPVASVAKAPSYTGYHPPPLPGHNFSSQRHSSLETYPPIKQATSSGSQASTTTPQLHFFTPPLQITVFINIIP